MTRIVENRLSLKEICFLDCSQNFSLFKFTEANAAKALAEAEAVEHDQAMQEWKGLFFTWSILIFFINF